MWDSVLESLPVQFISDREERASLFMLCRGRALMFFSWIGQAKVQRSDAGGPC